MSIDYSGNDFKAIVYDFMPNGSLESCLHPDTNGQMEQQFLNLLERVSILLDVAFALDYLHCHGPAPVVHCDLKSSFFLKVTGRGESPPPEFHSFIGPELAQQIVQKGVTTLFVWCLHYGIK